MNKFFPFFSTSTSVLSLFLCLFGITAFVNMLFGGGLDLQKTILITNTLPNPLEFVQACTNIFGKVLNLMKLPDLSAFASGNDIFNVLFRLLTAFVNFLSWTFSVVAMVVYFLVFAPAYCIWWLFRLLLVVFTLMGIDTSSYSILWYNWNQFFEFI